MSDPRWLESGAWRRSLRVRLLGGVLVLSSLGALAAGVTVHTIASSVLRRQLTDRLEGISTGQAREIDRWIRTLGEDVVFMSRLPSIRTRAEGLLESPEPVPELLDLSDLRSSRQEGARFREVFLLDARDAKVLASTNPSRVGDFELLPEYWAKGKAGPTIQEVYPSVADGSPSVTVAAPVRSEDGTILGVLAAHLNLDDLETIIGSGGGVTEDAEVYLVSEVGDFVNAHRFGREEYLRGPRSDGIRRALAGEVGVERYDNYRGDPVIGAFRWLPERRMALLVEVPEHVALRPARNLSLTTMGVLLVLVLVLGLASGTLADQIVAPLEGLRSAARRLAEGDFGTRVPEGGDDEVADLARAFNEMTTRLESVYADLHEQVATTTQAFAAVQQGRTLLQAIVDNSDGIVTVTDRQGRLQLVNERFRELFTGRVDPSGQLIAEVLPSDVAETYVSAEQAAFAEGRTVETKFTLRRPDERLHFVAVAFPLGSDGLHAGEVAVIALDRTESVRAEEERALLETQLHQSQRLESLGLLAGGIAHDFNNLLQAILGHAALAEDARDRADVRDHLGQVQTAATRAAELTGQLLAYAGRRSLGTGLVELNRVVGDLSELMVVSVPKSARLITGLCDGQLPVAGDTSQIGQVIMNLLSNAVDALPNGHGTVEIHTGRQELGPKRAPCEPTSHQAEDGPYAVIRVVDSGEGMDPDTLDRIFDPFFTTKETGHGLGLAAVLGIVRSAGGDLTVESTRGMGTTFRIYLPLAGQRVKGEDTPEATSVPARPLAGRTVLLADDEAGVRSFASRVLQRGGAEVLEAEDGDVAVRRFDDSAVLDMAILDLSMPGRGGVEVLSQIRLARPELPVVLASGFDMAGTLGDVLDDPFVELLQKPYRPSDLMEKVTALLGS